MADRNPRRLIVIIIITILVVAAVGLAFYLGQSTSAPPPTTPTPTVSTPVTPNPTYVPTNREGSPEPGLQTGSAVAGDGGSKAGPAGLPLGYTHDQTGAVNAATNYLIWMNSLKIADKATADAMAASAAADDATREALIDSFDALRSGMTDLTADQPEPARGAYAVAGFTRDAASIYVWGPEVITDATGRTEHLWGINAIGVVWASGDWKLKGELVSKVGGAAVDPLDPAGNPSAEEKHSILRRTPADPGDINDSADQTWFEYTNAPH